MTTQAELYELRTQGIDKDRHAIETLIPPTHHVLEVGCGTGRILKWLVERGQQSITGIELRHDLLQLARTKLAHARHVELLEQDLLQYQSEHGFDSILFAFNVLAEFTTHQLRVAALQHARSLLNSNGSIIVICDLDDLEHLETYSEHRFELVGRRPTTHSVTGRETIDNSVWQVTIQSNRDLSELTSVTQVTYKNSIGETLTDQYRSALLDRHELLNCYKDAGLTLQKEFGSYQLDPFTKKSVVAIDVLG